MQLASLEAQVRGKLLEVQGLCAANADMRVRERLLQCYVSAREEQAGVLSSGIAGLSLGADAPCSMASVAP